MAKQSTESAGRTWRERIVVFGPAVMLTLAALAVTFLFVKPAPPRHIVMATGPEHGAYDHFGRLYRDRLKREGITLTIENTPGSIENIERLRDGKVDIAFVQGGTGDGIDAPDLRSLASLYFEPLWVFVRSDVAVAELTDLRGRRVAVGEARSGTQAVALQLLADDGIRPGNFAMLPLGGADALRALRQGTADAAFFVLAAPTPLIHDLLSAPGIRLLSIRRAAAYRLRHRFLSILTLPEGASDLALDLPHANTTLLAAAANLVVRDDFHPALAELMLRIAREIHGEPGVFEEAGQFPSRAFLEYPISDQAKRFFDSGPSLLQRYLPFWAANLIDRLVIMVLPLATLLYPIFKIVPPTYDWRMKSNINRWYKEMQRIEQHLDAQTTAEELHRQLDELERVDNAVQHLSMPLSYANALYDLRSHIELLRNRLRKAADRVSDPPSR